MIRIACITAEPVPFGKQDNIYLMLSLFQVKQLVIPFGTLKCLRGIIFVNDFPDCNLIVQAMLAQPFFLVALRKTFVGLFVRTYADV
ncbi:hypothetical protein A9P82_08750 [Arachidicoccus ginsenosidimutans]|nr:hypothetical protein A9P82_08750 [Arachidicoccus sp. BS20]